VNRRNFINRAMLTTAALAVYIKPHDLAAIEVYRDGKFRFSQKGFKGLKKGDTIVFVNKDDPRCGTVFLLEGDVRMNEKGIRGVFGTELKFDVLGRQ
jgi:hypothetical protein